MRKIMTVCAMLGAFSLLGLAWSGGNTWSGTLVDRNCYHHKGSVSACVAKPTSGSYLLDSKGTMYELDSATNEGVQMAVQSLDGKANNIFPPSKDAPVFAGMVGHMNKRGHISATRLQVEH